MPKSAVLPPLESSPDVKKVESFILSGIPLDTVWPVRVILQYEEARRAWPRLIRDYSASIELALHWMNEAQAAQADYRALEEDHASAAAELGACQTYRCRRRLQPLVRLLLKPSTM